MTSKIRFARSVDGALNLVMACAKSIARELANRQLIASATGFARGGRADGRHPDSDRGVTPDVRAT